MVWVVIDLFTLIVPTDNIDGGEDVHSRTYLVISAANITGGDTWKTILIASTEKIKSEVNVLDTTNLAGFNR